MSWKLAFVVASAVLFADCEGVIRRRFECRADPDCPAYHWCEVEVAQGEEIKSKCLSFMNDHANADKTCTPSNDDCGQREVDDDFPVKELRFATQRCHKLAFGGHQCAKSYFMPCEQNEDCPDNFRCLAQGFSTGIETVCRPLGKPWVGHFADTCETNHDCGYDSLAHLWNLCVDSSDSGRGKRCL